MALTMTPQNLPHGQWSKIDHDHRHPEFSPWAVQWSIDYIILYTRKYPRPRERIQQLAH